MKYQKTKIVEVCNTNTYSLNKGIQNKDKKKNKNLKKNRNQSKESEGYNQCNTRKRIKIKKIVNKKIKKI